MQGDQTHNQNAEGRLPAGFGPTLTPEELERLSPVDREIWLAKKRIDDQRRMMRDLRARQQAENSRQLPASASREVLEDVQLDASVAEKALLQAPVHALEQAPLQAPRLGELDDATMRFRPVSVQPTRQRARAKKPQRSRRTLDIIGWTLEGLVIIAILVLFGNWLLSVMGISVDLFGSGQTTNRLTSKLSPEGPVLNVMAEGEIYVPPTPTFAPATPTPIILATPTVTRVLPTPTVPQLLVVAPTPAPFIVQAAPVQPGKPKFAPPTRVLIPKIGLDLPIVEVTVNLGDWQVADYAVGHHQGTANAGDSSNMVLAGHRDIRGSVFLKLNELQLGDEFKVFSSVGVYRYVVSEIKEVAPTDINVMSPSTEAIATLITCTPVGIASKRLIVKAKLVS